MMINYYRQNEMCTKNCYKNCVTFIIVMTTSSLIS